MLLRRDHLFGASPAQVYEGLQPHGQVKRIRFSLRTTFDAPLKLDLPPVSLSEPLGLLFVCPTGSERLLLDRSLAWIF